MHEDELKTHGAHVPIKDGLEDPFTSGRLAYTSGESRSRVCMTNLTRCISLDDNSPKGQVHCSQSKTFPMSEHSIEGNEYMRQI